jgi:L-seryl-tRNA(Ser) seleniumtransferase
LASIDELIQRPDANALVLIYGRAQVVKTLKLVMKETRLRMQDDHPIVDKAQHNISPLTSKSNTREQLSNSMIKACADQLMAVSEPRLKELLNLTGTVLHTNFGRALYAQSAIEAANLAMRAHVNLEYDLDLGKRGERDDHVESLLCELTGAQAATVVNNNAAAVLLSLSTLGSRKEVLISRGELVEIGGSFRIPDVMKRAGALLKEVGTTNRTHLKDFEDNITPKTGLLMKVHTSNYAVQGFTAEVSQENLSQLAQAHALPVLVDLGSGTLTDLNVLGLSHEPTVSEVIRGGANVVTFSGDKLLGGPQCGIIVGDKALIERMRKNPLRRALRLDKVMIAALEATLKLYLNPENLERDLPTLRLFKREANDIERQAHRLCPLLQDALRGMALVNVVPCASQVGSGALPVQTMPSFALAITPLKASKGHKSWSEHALEKVFRGLPTPILGRTQKGLLLLDLRCLEERQEALFCNALQALKLALST